MALSIYDLPAIRGDELNLTCPYCHDKFRLFYPSTKDYLIEIVCAKCHMAYDTEVVIKNRNNKGILEYQDCCRGDNNKHINKDFIYNLSYMCYPCYYNKGEINNSFYGNNCRECGSNYFTCSSCLGIFDSYNTFIFSQHNRR